MGSRPFDSTGLPAGSCSRSSSIQSVRGSEGARSAAFRPPNLQAAVRAPGRNFARPALLRDLQGPDTFGAACLATEDEAFFQRVGIVFNRKLGVCP